MIATKTQICTKYLEELDKTMEYLKAMRTFCENEIKEQEQKECGKCDECMNEQERITYNAALQAALQNRKAQKAQDIEKLKSMERHLRKNMMFKIWRGNVDLFEGILRQYKQIQFPEGTFKQPQEPCGFVHMYFLDEAKLPPELKQILREYCVAHVKATNGR